MVFYNSYTGSMDPNYVFPIQPKDENEEPKRYPFPTKRVSVTTNPFVSKQVEEFGKALNSGVRNVEVGALQVEKLETIPKEHLREIKRLSEITDTRVSLHGPIIDLSGFSEKGGWSEHQRQEAEQQVASVLDRAVLLDKNGNIPVVFHASASGFSEVYDKTVEKESKDKYIADLQKKAEIYRESDPEAAKQFEEDARLYKEGKKHFVQALGVVNRETGQVEVLPLQKKKEILTEFGAELAEKIWTPYEKLDSLNQNQWDEEKLKMLSLRKQITEIAERMQLKSQQLDALEKTGLKDSKQYQAMIEANTRDIDLMSSHIQTLNHDINSMSATIFDKFNKWTDKEDREKFYENKEMKNYRDEFKKIDNQLLEVTNEFNEKIREAESKEEKEKLEKDARMIQQAILGRKNDIMVSAVSKMPAPDIWKPTEGFAQEKLAETVSSAIITFAKEHPDFDLSKAPVLAIENWHPNTPMGRAESLKEAVHMAREKFAEKLTSDKDFKGKYSKKDADKLAEKLIGATWDMGHINFLRKSGYSEEELKKKVIEETQKIADVVKHLHITDNFGFSDAHLPPGMGNVPVADIMETLKKAGFEGLGVAELGGYINEFGVNPYQRVIEHFDNPMYSENAMEGGMYKSIPKYWQGSNYYQDPFVEFPQQHFNLYSSSFTTLPKTFGGQVGGEKSRFSDTPNQ